MARTIFKQDILVAAPYEVVQEHLKKLMTNIAETNPFVLWARYTQTTTMPDGVKIDHYLVRDRMRLGPFPIEFTYKVDMSVTATGRLVSDAYQSLGIHLHNQTWCEPLENETRICEHIDITAPRLLIKPTYEGAVTAHKQLFANLKAKIMQERSPVASEKPLEEQ